MNIQRSTSHRNFFGLLLIIVVMLVFSIFIGLGVGTGQLIIVAPFAMLIPAIYLLMRPDLCLIFFAGLTLLVSGSLKYFFGLGQFQWALSALGIALLGYSLIRSLFNTSTKHIPTDGFIPLWFLWWAGLFFASAANELAPLDYLVGIRVYLPVFGVFAYIAYCRPKEQLLKQIILFMLVIASIQWGFCLYQKLVVLPVRIARHYPGSPWDSIVGSFGGDKFGGGESGSLGIYLSIILVIAVALKKYAQINSIPFFIVMMTSLSAMALTESKVIALMVPLGCFIVYRDFVFKEPIKFFSGMIFTACLMFGLLIVYHYMYWQTDNNMGLFDSLYYRLFYSFDPSFQASTTNLGRIGSIIFWWEKHSIIDNSLTFLFGHGFASSVSASSIIGEGVAVKQYRIMLDTTGATKLLWETGLVGLSLFISVFVLGFFRVRNLKNNQSISIWHRAGLQGVEAAMVLMPLSIFYEVTIVSSLPMQFLAMFLLGYVAYWWRETSGGRRV